MVSDAAARSAGRLVLSPVGQIGSLATDLVQSRVLLLACKLLAFGTIRQMAIRLLLDCCCCLAAAAAAATAAAATAARVAALSRDITDRQRTQPVSPAASNFREPLSLN